MDEAFIIKEIGKQGIIDLVAAFYKKVPNDNILGPMYPLHDMDGAEKRMRDFMLFRLAGDETYINERGHPRLRARHMPFRIDSEARDRWMKLMRESMEECTFPIEVKKQLDDFFIQIADFMRNSPS